MLSVNVTSNTLWHCRYNNINLDYLDIYYHSLLIRLAAILVIISVSSFISVVILYLHIVYRPPSHTKHCMWYSHWDIYHTFTVRHWFICTIDIHMYVQMYYVSERAMAHCGSQEVLIVGGVGCKYENNLYINL